MAYPIHLLPTTVVGSYPQPDWLVDRTALEQHGVPRTHAHDIWRIPADLLELDEIDFQQVLLVQPVNLGVGQRAPCNLPDVKGEQIPWHEMQVSDVDEAMGRLARATTAAACDAGEPCAGYAAPRAADSIRCSL